MSDSEWILNGGAVLKVLVAVFVGVLGIWYACANGFKPDPWPRDVPARLDQHRCVLGYLSIIIFNFTGFEVICTFRRTCRTRPATSPRPSCWGGLAIGAIYLFCCVRHRRGHPGRPDRPGLRHDLRRNDHGGETPPSSSSSP